jgi:hypothetical protein
VTVVRANEKVEERKRSEPTLGEELAAFGDDDVVEMTNLQEKDTGIPGVVFISTSMGSHGPRVKYFLKTGRHQPSYRSPSVTNRRFWRAAFRSRI